MYFSNGIAGIREPAAARFAEASMEAKAIVFREFMGHLMFSGEFLLFQFCDGSLTIS